MAAERVSRKLLFGLQLSLIMLIASNLLLFGGGCLMPGYVLCSCIWFLVSYVV